MRHNTRVAGDGKKERKEKIKGKTRIGKAEKSPVQEERPEELVGGNATRIH
jgi:hypothetical protein